MPLGHITQTGNVSIPKKWRDELGIKPNSKIMLNIKKNQIIIEPLIEHSLKDQFKKIDAEIKRKKIRFSREEAIKDDLYD